MSSRKLRFSIIGCGAIAERHASIICKHHILLSVCDIIPERAEKLANKYNCTYFDSAINMLTHTQPDVVVVCTPNKLHAEHSIISIQHGSHVLCEKPMATSVEDCSQMIMVAKQHNKHLMVVKQNRYNPPVVALKQLLDNNALGAIFSFEFNCFWNRPAAYFKNSWRGVKAMAGGTLFTQFSHFIDLMYVLLGDVAYGKMLSANFNHKGQIDFEDTGLILFKMQSGVIGSFNYSLNTFKKNMEGSLTVLGEKGTVKIGGAYLNEITYWDVQDIPCPLLDTTVEPNQYDGYMGSMGNHDKVYKHLESVIFENQKPEPNMYEAMKTVEIISNIYNSSYEA
jgi:predicted dehydrogenase